MHLYGTSMVYEGRAEIQTKGKSEEGFGSSAIARGLPYVIASSAVVQPGQDQTRTAACIARSDKIRSHVRMYLAGRLYLLNWLEVKSGDRGGVGQVDSETITVSTRSGTGLVRAPFLHRYCYAGFL